MCSRNSVHLPEKSALQFLCSQEAPCEEKGTYEVVGLPMDILGPLSLTAAGNCYFLVMQTIFRWMEAVALPDQQAKTTTEGVCDPLHHKVWSSNFQAKLSKETEHFWV